MSPQRGTKVCDACTVYDCVCLCVCVLHAVCVRTLSDLTHGILSDLTLLYLVRSYLVASCQILCMYLCACRS